MHQKNGLKIPCKELRVQMKFSRLQLCIWHKEIQKQHFDGLWLTQATITSIQTLLRLEETSAGAITTIALGISNQEDFRDEISINDDPTLSTPT